MGIIDEYIRKNFSAQDYEKELIKLIKKYNKYRKTYLCVYAAAMGKRIPKIGIEQDDYYFLYDIFRDKDNLKQIDFYLETPGGSGEVAEEIVRLLHKNDREVHTIVSGEAKSAGTLIALSGNEIWMTETGSLGPIDAQIPSRFGAESAYDYMAWVDAKRKESQKNGYLNPFDAIIVAQITPGELNGVLHSLNFAEERVVEWLINYKFKNWKIRETSQEPVTNEYKKERAEEIAKLLTNRDIWRLHGRSIKIHQLEKQIKIKINKIDEDPKMADLVYRIQIVCKFLFERSTVYKIFATQDSKIFEHAAPSNLIKRLPDKEKTIDVGRTFQVKCPKCNENYKVFASFLPIMKIHKEIKEKIESDGFIFYPKNGKIKCKCGYEIDISGYKNDIETKEKRKIYAK